MDLDKYLQALINLEKMDSQGTEEEVVAKVMLEEEVDVELEEVEDFEGILPSMVMEELYLVVVLLDKGDFPVEVVVVEQLQRVLQEGWEHQWILIDNKADVPEVSNATTAMKMGILLVTALILLPTHAITLSKEYFRI
jgi:hypothetical protein